MGVATGDAAVSDATIVIVTRNRREEALRAVASAVEQRGNIEVLVIDDGSTDGTSDAVEAAFPSVRLERFASSEEVVARRNAAAALASGPILIGIDDDAEFTSADIALQTVQDFDDARVGAVKEQMTFLTWSLLISDSIVGASDGIVEPPRVPFETQVSPLAPCFESAS